jgi:hypothetical protein
MKKREGFVSNSSSSSFVVMGNGSNMLEEDFFKKFEFDEINVPDTFGGETEFGWQMEEYHDFGDKLNIAVLGARYSSNEDERLKEIEDLLKKKFNVSKVVFDLNLDNGNIDHQSFEESRDVFNDLESWLFDKDSYWQNGNDNY